jgi:predicted nucleic acid-binding protein
VSDFVVDNSVSMSWAFEDESNRYADSVLESLRSKEAAVPVIWRLEAANVLVVAQRQERLSAADRTRFLALIRHLPIEVVEENVRIRDLIDLAWDMELSAYDASYLELALNSALPLATCDKGLRQAAIEAGVDLWLKD